MSYKYHSRSNAIAEVGPGSLPHTRRGQPWVTAQCITCCYIYLFGSRIYAEMCHAFQEYAQHREDALESNYNIGRAAHHLGLVHIAAQYYHKCLDSTSASQPANEEGQGVPVHAATLRREAAFNLSLIYRGAGADNLARQVLRQHITV